MYYSNPYTIGETKIDKLSLLPFSEIMETYEKMMFKPIPTPRIILLEVFLPLMR